MVVYHNAYCRDISTIQKLGRGLSCHVLMTTLIYLMFMNSLGPVTITEPHIIDLQVKV